jgi:hypothetical protein
VRPRPGRSRRYQRCSRHDGEICYPGFVVSGSHGFRALLGKYPRTPYRGFLSLTSTISKEATPYRTGCGPLSIVRAVSHGELRKLGRLPARCGKSRAVAEQAGSDHLASSLRGIRLERNRRHLENDRWCGKSRILARSKARESEDAQETSAFENSISLSVWLTDIDQTAVSPRRPFIARNIRTRMWLSERARPPLLSSPAQIQHNRHRTFMARSSR